jgi:hypothetical protein
MPFTRTWAETFDQHSLVANIVITSLALVGGVLLGADAVARFDPIYYLVDASRADSTGFTSRRSGCRCFLRGRRCRRFLRDACLDRARWRLKPCSVGAPGRRLACRAAQAN